MLDDYSPLRNIARPARSKQAHLFKPRKALQYSPIMGGTGSSGASEYSAQTPRYGATITYYLPDGHSSMKSERKKEERKAKTEDVPFPGWEALDKEMSEASAEAVLMIKNSDGDLVDVVSGPLRRGLHRVNWGLRTSASTTTNVTASAGRGGGRWGGYFGGGGMSISVDPGEYQVSLYKRVGGEMTMLSGPVTLEVDRIRTNVLTNPLADKHEEYNKALVELNKVVRVYEHKFKKANARMATYERSLKNLKTDNSALTKAVFDLRETKNSLQREFGGSAAKAEVGEKDRLTLMDRLSNARGGYYGNSYGPTALHMQSFDMAKEMFARSKPKMDDYIERVNALGKKLEEAGAPIFLD